MPKDPTADTNHLKTRAQALARAGHLTEARELIWRVCRRHKRDAGAWSLLGAVNGQLGLLDKAVSCCRRALRLDPGAAETHYNLGAALQRQGKLEPAAAAYRTALTLHPTHADACNNLGNVLRALGRTQEALWYFDRALQIAPGLAQAHCNRSLLRLLLGDFERGWKEFEWRWSRPEHPPRRFPQPAWNGGPLTGRTVLLHAEQGYGDTLQFIRYAPMLAERGARVVCECPPSLIRLLTNCPGVHERILQDETLPPFDIHVPLLSLPRLFRTTLHTIPTPTPYLTAPTEPRPTIDRLLDSAGPGPRIGVVWAGNPGHVNDRNRSCPTKHLRSLAQVPGATLFSLQKGPRAGELSGAGVPALDLGPLLEDFADTAYALTRIDLLITVDTAAAHLGGALGRPTWVLLPFDPDWRWLLGRDDSPWYSTVRLFRQPAPDDWIGALRALANHFEEWSAARQTQ